MITIFNRAELFYGCELGGVTTVWSTLKANGIEYEMSTKQNVSTLRKNIHYSQGMNVGHGGIPASYFGDAPTYIYRIYVKKKDLERARKCGGGGGGGGVGGVCASGREGDRCVCEWLRGWGEGEE